MIQYLKIFFENKIVLFGPYTLGMQDQYLTPLDKQNPMYGVEIHGNILQNLMDESLKIRAPYMVEMFMLIVFGLMAFIIGTKSRMFVSHMLNGGLLVLVLVIANISYQQGYVLNIVYTLAIIVMMDIVIIVMNYIMQLMEKRHITVMFGRYVAPQVVEKILAEGSDQIHLGGVKKNVSILFVDIRGFTPLSEVAEAEDVVDILNEYLELCSGAIFDNHGTLDKFIGDATMALFNAPLDLEDHEFQAVKTAWQMKVKGEVLAKSLYEKYGRNVHFGIGINTGPAIIGNIGSKRRMDYTAIGDAVNTAARLESNAKAGQILISEEVYLKVVDRVEVTPLGLISVKGKQTEINVFQIDGIK